MVIGMFANYYVYALFRPDNGAIFYIGMGKGNRAWDHVSRRKERQSHKDRVICKLIDTLGYTTIPVVLLREGLIRTEAIKIEIALIAAIGRHPKGPLTNMTDGGDGGKVYLDAEGEALYKQRASASRIGKKQSPEWSAKIGKALRGKPKAPHVIKALQTGYDAMDKSSPEWRETQAARTRGKTKSPEHRAKIAAALKGRRPSPQCIESVREANKRRVGPRGPRREKPR
jgi:hypothetical protein